MAKMIISDVTLREYAAVRESVLSFKEKLEIARTLNRLKVDVIELPRITDSKADILANRTIASAVSVSAVSATAGFTVESVETAWESVREAAHPMLHIMVPVSPIQMEYTCKKKGPAVLEMIGDLVSKARCCCEQVEFSAADATRAEVPFLCTVIETAVNCGASRITLCDSAGTFTPDEMATFIDEIYAGVPALKNVELAVQVSDELNMAVACAAAAIRKGAVCVKTAMSEMGYPTLENFAHFVQVKGNALNIQTGIRVTELNQAAKQLQWVLQTQRSEGSPFDAGVNEDAANISLEAGDSISEVIKAVKQLGYDLTEDDGAKVYEAVQRVAQKKHFVGTRELEAIIASTAMQVPSTYRVVSYVFTSGNTVTPMATVALEKNGKKLQGMSVGDGPVDAVFLAIEQVVGHHYELDDFQINSVTEGREAMGSAFVKLRADNGKVYSGSGISTDIIGACVRAYVSALNKIVFEEV